MRTRTRSRRNDFNEWLRTYHVISIDRDFIEQFKLRGSDQQYLSVFSKSQPLTEAHIFGIPSNIHHWQ